MATKVAIEVDVKVEGADKNLGKVKTELKGVEKQAKKSTDQIKSGFDAASKQATSLPGPVGRAAQAFQSMVGGIKKGIVALKTLKGALLATGLGALVVVVGSLVAYFTETERGAQKLRIAMAAVGAAVGVVKDTKAAIALERAMNQVKVQERELAVERAKTLQVIAEARLAAEDETKSAEERIAKLKEAAALEADLTSKELANEEEKLRIMQEQAALNESDEATLQAIADQEAKVAQVQLNSLNLNRRLKTELNSLEREIETERKQRATDEQKRLEEANKKELELLEQLKETRIS
jgi:chromosome segregation ATPase